MLKIFEKWFFVYFCKKSAKKPILAFLALFCPFLKKCQKNFNFHFLQKLCFRAVLGQKHYQKYQNDKKRIFCKKYLKNIFLPFFDKKVPKRPILAILALFCPFFKKMLKKFCLWFFLKVVYKGCFRPKTLQKISKWQKNIFCWKF